MQDAATPGEMRLLGLEPRTYGLKVCSDPPETTGNSEVSASGAAPKTGMPLNLDDLAKIVAAWPWRAARKFRPMFVALTALVLITVGMLYWLDKTFPPPRPPRIPISDGHHII